MKPRFLERIDARDALQIVEDVLQRRPGFVPEWQPPDKGPDAALLRIFARYVETILQRLNQAPEKNKLAFLDTMGIRLIPAQASRVPVVVEMSAEASDSRIPAGTRIIAPPPPESTEQIVFETERSAGLATARIKQVFSLWPGRDQYIDHSEAYLAGEPFQLFKKSLLKNTPHAIYIAHDTLLSLAGKSRVEVEFELSRAGADSLDTLWEYWDGKVWRGFKAMHPICLEASEQKADGTNGFTRSGRFRLETDCAETAKTTVNGIEAFWIRGSLTDPLLHDPGKALPEVEGIRVLTVIERRVIEGDEDSEGRITEVKTGLLPERAFAGGTELDLTKPFFPYGNQPQTGDAFYFASEEIFSKPGARVEIVVLRSESPQDRISLPGEPASITLTSELESAPADGTEIEITAIVIDFKGDPVDDGTIVRFNSSLEGSKFDMPEPRTINGSAIVKISSTQAGEARISAQAEGATTLEDIVIKFFDRTIDATLERNIITAGLSTSTSSIDVTVLNLDGEPYKEVDVIFTSNLGKFDNNDFSLTRTTNEMGQIDPVKFSSDDSGIANITIQSDIATFSATITVHPEIEITAEPPVVVLPPIGLEIESHLTATIYITRPDNTDPVPVPRGTPVRFSTGFGIFFKNGVNIGKIPLLFTDNNLGIVTVDIRAEFVDGTHQKGTAKIRVEAANTFGTKDVEFKNTFGKTRAKKEEKVATLQQPIVRSTATSMLPISSVLTNGATKEEPPRITKLTGTVKWEYWNGAQWAVIPISSLGPDNLNSDSRITFSVPFDIARTKVNDQEGFWIRVRVTKSGFGLIQRSTFTDQITKVRNDFEFIIPKPPVLSDFRLGYTWEYGPFHAERVLTYNDFEYEDQTEAARWPGQTFLPFKPMNDVTPALYAGFDKKLPVDRMNLFFDVAEKREETLGPALIWEYWTGFNWRALVVEDETVNLRVPGMASFIAAEDSRLRPRFGTSLHWLRARLKEDGPPGEPTLNGIFLNAVWASQRQTITDESLGVSTGQPNQVFTFRQIPVLTGERIEVRELAGARANVEWRILATELFGGEARKVQALEVRLGAENNQTDIEEGPLRLRRDRNKRVTEAWVLWQGQPHLLLSGPNDRHYVLDPATGRLIFGDGETGEVPPPGAAILAKRFRSGGGIAGNIAARSALQLTAGIGGVEAVFNPRPGEGGADSETLTRLQSRGPQTLRHRGHALAPRDYETMAREASPAVAFARAIPNRDPSVRNRPGWVTVLIIPQSKDVRPWPSFGLREQVRKYIAAHAPADLVAANHIYVAGPEYLPIDVSLTLSPVDPAEAGSVEQRVREALLNFLHPVSSGPEGMGWELGRDVFLSDVATVVERVPGVDFVEDAELILNHVAQGERVKIADDRIVVAGELRIKLI